MNILLWVLCVVFSAVAVLASLVAYNVSHDPDLDNRAFAMAPGCVVVVCAIIAVICGLIATV